MFPSAFLYHRRIATMATNGTEIHEMQRLNATSIRPKFEGYSVELWPSNTRFMVVDIAFESFLLFGYIIMLRQIRAGRTAPGRPSCTDEAQIFLRLCLYLSSLYDIFPPCS